MKKILILLVILPILFLAGNSEGNEEAPNYWYCYQVGTIGKNNVFAFSRIWLDRLEMKEQWQI